MWLRCRAELSQGRMAATDFIHSLFFLKAEVSCGSCPGAVRTGNSTVWKQYPLAAAAAVCTSNSSFPFTSHPAPLFADVFARKGRQVCRCAIHTDIGVWFYAYAGASKQLTSPRGRLHRGTSETGTSQQKKKPVVFWWRCRGGQLLTP